MEDRQRGFILGPGEGASIGNPLGGALTFKVRGEQNSGALTVFESLPAPGEGPPLHSHQSQDEVLYVLEGRLRVRLDEQLGEAPAGSFVFIPHGVPHTWQNVSDVTARLLVLLTPAGLETFFDRFAELPPGAPWADEFRRLGAEVGMQVVGPPLSQSHPL